MNATLIWIINIVLIICSLVMIVIVLMQDTDNAGLGAAFGGSMDTFFGKNKSKTSKSRLEFLTKILAVVIAVLSVAMVILFRMIKV